MKRFLLASTLIVGCLAMPIRSDAQLATVCTNCATIWQQLQDAATQVKQLATQAAQLQTELNQYTQLVASGLSLPMSVWTSVQGDMAQVRNLTNAASLLTGNSGTILTRLQSAQGYANQAAYLPQGIGAQFTQWQQTLGNANQALGRVAATQQQQELGYTALQTTANSHSQTAAGQTQAIQASNEQLSIVNTQLQQVQTTLLAAAQQAATRDEVNEDRTAMQEAAMLNFSTYQPVATTGSRGF